MRYLLCILKLESSITWHQPKRVRERHGYLGKLLISDLQWYQHPDSTRFGFRDIEDSNLMNEKVRHILIVQRFYLVNSKTRLQK